MNLRLTIPKLKKEQVKRASEIFMGLGHICVASVALPTLVDKFNPLLLILGIVVSIVFWIISMIIAGKV